MPSKRMARGTKKKRNVTGQTIQRIRMAAKPKTTQEDMVGRLARLGISFSQSQIAKIENGDRAINDYELAAFARALKVPVQKFFE